MKRMVLPLGAVAVMFTFSAEIFATTAQHVAPVKAAYAKKTRAAHKKESHHVIQGSNPFGQYVTITTSPFLGKKSAFDASDLLYMYSSMNEDLTLLEKKQAFEEAMAARGDELDRPILQLSGGVEGELYSTGSFGASATDGISLSTAELDMHAIASSWASAFMSLDYNGSPVSSGNRAPNSTIYLNRGFATIGDLSKCPAYFSIGLMYAPFGRYASGMLSTPVTQSMGRVRAETALLGFSLDNGVFGSVYGFSGSQTSGSSDLIKQEGVNLGIKRQFSGDSAHGKFSLGGGWISNMADSQGAQTTGGTTFGGFASATGSNVIAHRVSGVDAHGRVTYGAYTILSEYLTATRRYANTDMRYNGKGAEPAAIHTELDYALPYAVKYGTTLGVSYGHTWQALALNLPRNSYAAFASTSFWRDTVESIEYRHDNDYRTTNNASGSGSAIFSGTGRSRNSVLARVGVYF